MNSNTKKKLAELVKETKSKENSKAYEIFVVNSVWIIKNYLEDKDPKEIELTESEAEKILDELPI